MNKKEYIQLSKELKLSSISCPIVAICERRAYTIYLASYTKVGEEKCITELIKQGELDKDFNAIKVPIIGDSPSKVSGNNNYYMCNLCPEVNLFSSLHSITPCRSACTAVEYDKYFQTENKLIIKEYGHFSECTEYNQYMVAGEKDKSNKSELKNLIANNHIKEVIVKISETINNNSSTSLFNKWILLQSHYTNLTEQEQKGILSIENTQLSRNKFINNILELIDELEN